VALRACGEGRRLAVDVAVVPGHEEDVLEHRQGGGAEEGAEALGEPVKAHDDALHVTGRVDVSKLQTYTQKCDIFNWGRQATRILRSF